MIIFKKYYPAKNNLVKSLQSIREDELDLGDLTEILYRKSTISAWC